MRCSGRPVKTRVARFVSIRENGSFSHLIREVMMCEATAFFKKEQEEKMLMEAVAAVIPMDGKYQLRSILGERLEVEGKITEINYMTNRIVFSPQD